jgi:plasmid replication initiation protein
MICFMDEIIGIDHSKQLTKLSNTLIKGRYELTKQEQSLIFLLIAQIDKEDEDFKDYRLTVADLDKLSGVQHKSQRIKELQLSIMKKPIILPNRACVNWFSYIEPIQGESALLVRFDKSLKPYLLQMKAEFTKAELPTLLSFNSKYSSRLFLLLKCDFERQRKQKKVFNYTIDYLLTAFEMPETYRIRHSEFKKAFLNRCCKEINEKTAFTVDYKEKKNGRKITSIDFIISEKITAIEKPKDTLESLLIAHGIGRSKIAYMLNWGLDIGYIRKVIKYIKRDDLEWIVGDMLMSNYEAMASKKAVFISKCEAWIKDNYTEQQATINLDDLSKYLDEAIKNGDINI